MHSIFNKLYTTLVAFPKAALTKIFYILNITTRDALSSVFNELTTITLDLATTASSLAWYQTGHPLHITKCNAVITLSRTLEETLYILDRTHKGGLQELLDTFYFTAHPILALDVNGMQEEDCRPLMEGIITQLTQVYSQLAFDEKIFVIDFPLTRMFVRRIAKEDWKGGWVLMDLNRVNPIARWVKPKTKTQGMVVAEFMAVKSPT